MKSLLLLMFVLLLGFASRAQQYQFIYLQTDNKQPFYVRVNEKLYSSSAAGYLVIPKLKEGSHTLSVGFPKNEWPNQNLSVSIAGKDLGFILKQFESNKWGLFNLQTMEVVKAETGSNNTASTTTIKTDEFSNILADVVNTASIKEEKKEVAKPVVATELPKPKPAEPVVVKAEPTPVPVVEPKVVATAADIRKLSSIGDRDGLAMVYVDKMNDGADTIRIFIETPKTALSEAPVQNEVVKKETAKVEKKSEPALAGNGQDSPKFLDINLANPNDPSSPGNQEAPAVKPNSKMAAAENSLKPLTINSDCKQLATESDFLKIRKKMSSEKDDDDMVKAATKMFKQKCYSTEQVKNLSVLFLKDEGKYKLFDAAYPYIHDTQSFKQLESQLKDAYIITRFRAMIRN